jgi:prepilin-type N-terminal cleavage/methylation domain-containing protein
MASIRKLTERGFTVVELLIVIVVIGILAALVLNSFAGVQAKARDTQRKTDINAIATQLEACYNDTCNGTYPSLAALQQDSTGGWVETHLKGLDKNALRDSTNALLQGSTPTATAQYQYDTSGATCTGTTVDDTCTSFVLRSWQEQNTSTPYTKNSLNK